MRIRSILLGALTATTILGPAAPAVAAWCAVVDGVWKAGHRSAESGLIGTVNAMQAAIAAQNAINLQLMMSTLGVMTKQISVDGGRESTAVRQTAEAMGGVFAEQAKREAIVKAEEDFGPLGQAVDSCRTVDQMRRVNGAFMDYRKHGGELARSADLDVRPSAATPIPEVVAARVKGYTPAAVNVTTLFDPTAEEKTKDLFIANLVGLPLPKPGRNTPAIEAEATMLTARKAEAWRSAPIASVAAVRAMYEEDGHVALSGEGDQAMSTMEALDWLVGRYGGGNEFERWSAEVATKSERGLLQEYTRLRAVSLKLQQMRSESASRTSTVLGVLLAAEVSAQQQTGSQ